MFDLVGNPLEVGDVVAHQDTGTWLLATISGVQVGSMGRGPRVNLQNFKPFSDKRVENVYRKVKPPNELVKVFNVVGFEGVDGIYWDYVRRMVDPIVDLDLLMSTDHDFLLNPLKDKDIVAFRGFRGEEIGRIRMDEQGWQGKTEVLHREGDRLVLDRLISPSRAKHIVLLPNVHGYHCNDKSWDHNNSCYASVASSQVYAPAVDELVDFL